MTKVKEHFQNKNSITIWKTGNKFHFADYRNVMERIDKGQTHRPWVKKKVTTKDGRKNFTFIGSDF